MADLYAQYGCGLSCPDGWINYDASPTLRLQKIPLVGALVRSMSRAKFPKNVKYGDIIKGLPLKDGSVKGLYCSHVLEHLAYDDMLIAIKNSYRLLHQDGKFRLIVPDMELICRKYINAIDNNQDPEAVKRMLEESILGIKTRKRGFLNFFTSFFGNANHLWMWDFYAMEKVLSDAGFKNIRPAKFGDSTDQHFSLVESEARFRDAVAIECSK